MITLTTELETNAVYSEDMKKRFELTKKFKENKGKSILVIMMNPSAHDIRKTDTTTNLLLNHLCNDSDKGYTTVTIWNLFADICMKLKPKVIDGSNDNMEYLDKLLEREYDSILIGWGNTFDGNKIILKEKRRLSKKLERLQDKLLHITDPCGEIDCAPMHPLFAGQRLRVWNLSPYKFPEFNIKQEEEEKNNVQDNHENKREEAIRKMKEKNAIKDLSKRKGEQ